MEVGDLDAAHLRDAIEFAVTVAAEAKKRRAPIEVPSGLGPWLKAKRIPTKKLPALRRAIDGDDRFREAVAVGADAELVGEIGSLWLRRPPGWVDEVRRLAAEHDAAQAHQAAEAEVRRERKRREAAEAATARAGVELAEARSRIERLDGELEELRAEVHKLADERDEMRTELIDARNEARHARDREAAAEDRRVRAEVERDEAIASAERAASVRDEAITERVRERSEISELADVARAAADLAGRLTFLASAADPEATRESDAPRQPLAVPGGLTGMPERIAEFLLRAGAAVLVDGYNVAKLAWPDRVPAELRRGLLDVVEDVARRSGVDLTVVFDGADVVGAATGDRRLVRVVFSPSGVSADDVIRDEVARLPTSRPVVVVTNDREIVDDVRAMGANTVRSEHFLAAARR